MFTKVLGIPVLGVGFECPLDERPAEWVWVVVFYCGCADPWEHAGGVGVVEDSRDGWGSGLEDPGGGEEVEVVFSHAEHVVAGEEVFDPEVAG